MAEGGVQFVLTGQQPGMFGGPLLMAYKVITAIALAEWLERTLSVPTVPIYWCGGDDTDFQEIRHQWFLSSELSPVKLSLPAMAQESARPIGDIPNEFTLQMCRKDDEDILFVEAHGDTLKLSKEHYELAECDNFWRFVRKPT